jgi:hypothetical protein
LSPIVPLHSSPIMAAHAPRLAQIFTTTYACRLNAELLHPKQSVLLRPHILEKALLAPLQRALESPQTDVSLLAASISFVFLRGKSVQTRYVPAYLDTLTLQRSLFKMETVKLRSL